MLSVSVPSVTTTGVNPQVWILDVRVVEGWQAGRVDGAAGRPLASEPGAGPYAR